MVQWFSYCLTMIFTTPRTSLSLSLSLVFTLPPRRAYTQSGSTSDFRFWDAGLRGEGEVVGVADSGIDMRSCMFRDDSHPTPQPFPTGTTYSNRQHRKVIQYVAHADGDEGVSGGQYVVIRVHRGDVRVLSFVHDRV